MNNFGAETWFSGRNLFTLVFFYSLTVGLLIQLVILPDVIPALHAGHGLLKGGDWIVFHQQALQLASHIRHEGWAVWELRPLGNAPIGIAAAVYAFSGVSEPWILMPLNAALFAVAATCLYMVFARIASRRLAFAATMPFVLFPSAAVIYGQIHKDVWSIAGVSLLTLVWVRFAVHPALKWKDAALQGMLALSGALLIWLVRPYLVQVVLAASVLTVSVIAVRVGLAQAIHPRRSLPWWAGIALSVALLVTFAGLPPGNHGNLGNQISEPRTRFVWHDTLVIPASADAALATLAESRHRFRELYPLAGSNIDTEVQFHSAADVVRYIPRALTIGLFSPFPDLWTASGVSSGAAPMRLLAGVETVFAYPVMLGVLLLFMRRGARGVTTVLLIQAIVPLILLALTVSNVGTLYRMRYGYWQILMGLGTIGWGMLFLEWNARRRGNTR
ncbi:hypothetical protein [Thiobacillus sp.]